MRVGESEFTVAHGELYGFLLTVRNSHIALSAQCGVIIGWVDGVNAIGEIGKFRCR